MADDNASDERPDDEDAPPNAADPAQYKKAVRGRRQQQRDDADWWRRTLASQQGRRIVWGLLTDCRTFEDVFAYGPNGFPDPHHSMFCRGQQQIGQRLLRTLMGYAPELVLQMHREHDPAIPRAKR